MYRPIKQQKRPLSCRDAVKDFPPDTTRDGIEPAVGSQAGEIGTEEQQQAQIQTHAVFNEQSCGMPMPSPYHTEVKGKQKKRK